MDKSGDDVKDQVFASLEAERRKLAEEVERMQQKMSSTELNLASILKSNFCLYF